jgi:hypothetical protein
MRIRLGKSDKPGRARQNSKTKQEEGMNMTTFEVGKRFPGMLPLQDSTEFSRLGDAYFLKVFLRDLVTAELEAFRSGQVKLALTVKPPVIFFLFQFPGMAWSDAPLSWHMIPKEDQRQEPGMIPADQFGMISLIVTDLGDANVKIIRQISVPGMFMNSLAQALKDQAQESFNQALYDQALAETYRQYTSDDLIEEAVRFWRQA